MTIHRWLAIGLAVPWLAAGCVAPSRAESASGAERSGRARTASEHTVAAKVSFAAERDGGGADAPRRGDVQADPAPSGDGFVPMEQWSDGAADGNAGAGAGEPTDGGAIRDGGRPDAPRLRRPAQGDSRWWQRAKDAGSALVPPVLQRASATPLPTATPLPSATPWPTATVPPTPTVDAIAAAGKPVRLEIPAIGVDAVVEHVGLTAERAMDVPQDWMNVAWYENGPLPGAIGNAVIAGHLDSSTGAPAVFWMLNRLAPGDQVTVTFDSGARFTFVVQELVEYDHDAEGEVIDTVFGDALAPNLNLVTCQGVWDYGNGTYDKRLVVFTALAPELTVHAAGGPIRD